MTRKQKLSAWTDALRALRREQIRDDARNPWAWSPGPRQGDDVPELIPAMYLSERILH